MRSPTRLSVAIVDDHPLFRLGVATTLRRDSSFAVPWTAATTSEARAHLAQQPVDLVLIDVTLETFRDGLELARQIRRDHPDTRVVAMSADRDAEAPALEAGAVAFLPKVMAIPEFVSVIRRIGAEEGLPVRPSAPRARGGSPRLSPRETEVLRQIQLGLTNREIAQNLGVSVTTVNKQVQSVLRKTGARNRAHAAGLPTAGIDTDA